MYSNLLPNLCKLNLAIDFYLEGKINWKMMEGILALERDFFGMSF